MLTVREGEPEDGAVAQQARQGAVDVGQEDVERTRDLLRVRALEVDVDVVSVRGADVAGQLKQRAEHTEGVLRLFVGVVEAADLQLLGVARGDLHGVDDESLVLAPCRRGAAPVSVLATTSTTGC